MEWRNEHFDLVGAHDPDPVEQMLFREVRRHGGALR